MLEKQVVGTWSISWMWQNMAGYNTDPYELKDFCASDYKKCIFEYFQRWCVPLLQLGEWHALRDSTLCYYWQMVSTDRWYYWYKWSHEWEDDLSMPSCFACKMRIMMPPVSQELVFLWYLEQGLVPRKSLKVFMPYLDLERPCKGEVQTPLHRKLVKNVSWRRWVKSLLASPGSLWSPVVYLNTQCWIPFLLDWESHQSKWINRLFENKELCACFGSIPRTSQGR